MLTDVPTIHNLVKAHFGEWHRAPAPPPRLARTTYRPCSLPDTCRLQAHPAASHPTPLGCLLLTRYDTLPISRPSAPLLEFQAAIHHHKWSTAPVATGLTYNMVKKWSALLVCPQASPAGMQRPPKKIQGPRQWDYP